jgi:flagellum-specific peptidoglycan hydrolase FlgJ
MPTTLSPEVIADAQAAELAYYPVGPYVSVTIAQWILESAWGADMSGANNCFGIKATSAQIAAGQATLRWTHETLNGQYKALPQYFANYGSLKDCFMAHAALLANSPYYHLAQAAQSPEAYAMALTGIYATGIPGFPYGEQLIKLINEYNLKQYDNSH